MFNLAQTPTAPNVTAQWVSFLLTFGVFFAINIKGWIDEEHKTSPFLALLSIPVGMGAFGQFLNIMNWGWVDDASGWVSGFVQLGDTRLAPFFWIIVSASMRAAQLFQGAKGPIFKLLKAIPDPLEAAAIIIAGAMGGLAMNGAPDWNTWLNGWADLVRDIGTQIGNTGALFGIG